MKKIKEYWGKNPGKRKLMIFGMAVATMSLSFGIYAFAQSFIDSFSDTTRIGSTWNADVDTAAGEIKSAVKTCDDVNWFCSANNVCANSLGDGNNIIVKRTNETSAQWKTTQTDCNQPECGQDGGQYGDNLVADNTVNFGATYPARQACKDVGGRLPTLAELQCIYNNRAVFGNNFGESYYWSATEIDFLLARSIAFVNGTAKESGKPNTYYVRCVKGW